ncbi:MAP7 domain-containing protein 1-like [Betta splendens]|uniref:MAP7 domain-containing protein 1-like n=1 Tax=Betta splendens TaxID=158456 RepID=A0A9W2XA54_BETSP|nr:MAP7 domain-containing protein 1-like [Betta splendens]
MAEAFWTWQAAMASGSQDDGTDRPGPSHMLAAPYHIATSSRETPILTTMIQAGSNGEGGRQQSFYQHRLPPLMPTPFGAAIAQVRPHRRTIPPPPPALTPPSPLPPVLTPPPPPPPTPATSTLEEPQHPEENNDPWQQINLPPDPAVNHPENDDEEEPSSNPTSPAESSELANQDLNRRLFPSRRHHISEGDGNLMGRYLSRPWNTYTTARDFEEEIASMSRHTFFLTTRNLSQEGRRALKAIRSRARQRNKNMELRARAQRAERSLATMKNERNRARMDAERYRQAINCIYNHCCNYTIVLLSGISDMQEGNFHGPNILRDEHVEMERARLLPRLSEPYP